MRFLLRVCAMALLPLGLACASGAAEEVVQMPAFVVEDKLALEKWTYFQLGSVEVISAAKSDVTMRTIAELENELTVIRAWLPADLLIKEMPCTIILDDRRTPLLRAVAIDDWRRGRGAVLLPVDDGDCAMVYLNLDFGDVRSLYEQDFLARNGKYFVSSWSSSALKRALRIWFRHLPAQPPDWFVEGLCNDVRLPWKARKLVIGGPEDRWLDEQLRNGRVLRPDGGERPTEFYSLEKTLAGIGADEHSPEHARWRLAAACFVWWALVSEHGRYEKALWRYVERCRREPFDGERTFQECFGKSIAEVQHLMTEYARNYWRNEVPLKVPEATSQASFSRGRPATNTEILRIHGGWARAASREYPELEPVLLGAAKQFLDAAKNASDPELQAERGLFLIQIGQTEEARRALEKALAGNTRRGLAAVRLSQLLLDAALKTSKDGMLSEADTTASLKPLGMAYARQPKLRDMYAAAAQVWMRSSAPIGDRHLLFLREAIEVFPRDSALALLVAHVHEKYGQNEQARRLAEHGLRFAPASEQANFREFLQTLNLPVESPKVSAP